MGVPDNMGSFAQLVPQLGMILVVGVAFYFMLIRPQQKQKKARAEMMKNMKVGDRVKTIGGVHGRIVELRDDVVTIESSRAKTQLVFDRAAISTVEGGGEETNADLQ